MDLNLATAAELESLPGVGPVMAERIIEARKAAPGGTFGSLEELRAIRGIKAKTFLRLRPYLKIEGL
jgi:competence protein ComEA